MFNSCFVLIIIQSIIAFILIAIAAAFNKKGIVYFIKRIIAMTLAIPISTAILYIIFKVEINGFCTWLSKDINNLAYFILGAFYFIVLWCIAYLFSKFIVTTMNKLIRKIKGNKNTN